MQKESKCALNIRDFPAQLRWNCRQKAAREKLTLNQFVIKALTSATADVKPDIPKNSKKG